MTLIEKFVNCRKLVISGPVGVGKSTRLQQIETYLKDNNIPYFIVPEYIDGDPNGKNMLQKFLSGEMNNFDFQMYILNFYVKYIKESILPVLTGDELIVFERLPDEGIAIFANITWNSRNGFTESEMRKLYYKVVEIDATYGLPSIFDLQFYPFTFTCIEASDNANLAPTAISLINNTHEHVVIGLFNTTDVCYKRIIMRAREGENKYTYDDADRFVQMYMNMYTFILHHKSIPFNRLKSLYYPIPE